MDLTAPAIADPEKYDTVDVVERKAQDLADQIKKSKHFIAFTGAGVSTSAGKSFTEIFKIEQILTRGRNSGLPRPRWQLDSESPGKGAQGEG